MVSNRLFLFQSRNRGSFDFKEGQEQAVANAIVTFQSRNRGSFNFRKARSPMSLWIPHKFQSRNRGSFDFKVTTTNSTSFLNPLKSFNLAIEVLLISSGYDQ